jgi:Spy/CpxP family protein refolding chaperone
MSTESPFPAPQPIQPAPKPRRLRSVLYASALLVGGGVIGAVVVGPTIGQGWYGPPWQQGWGPGRHDAPYGMHPGEFGGRMFGPGRVERGVDRALWFVDASTEQRQKIRGIVERTADDLFALREKHLEGRRQIGAVLGAATIDRGKLDGLRAEQMALADTASKRITEGLAEVAEVLTPTQRADLARWFDRWHRWRHG